MSVQHLFVCALIFHWGLYILIAGQELCEESVRVKLDGAEESLENSSITHNGTIFKTGTFWKGGEGYFGCPCFVKPCIRICTSTTLEPYNLTVPSEDFEVDVQKEGQRQTVKFYHHFYAILEKSCYGYLLDPELNDVDNHVILSNGSLHLLQINDVHGPHTFCIANNESKLTVKICEKPADAAPSNYSKAWKLYVYSVFMMISIVFLLLTEIAFILSPEMKNLHGKNIACQSGTLMMGMICLTVTYLIERDTHLYVCKILAYLTYFFMLSSFFWLSNIGFDIFWTFSDFKKMTGSARQTQKKKFKMYALYAITVPLFVFLIMVILDQVLPDTSSMSPGICTSTNWFRDRLAEFLYYQGPVLFLLLANVAFFSITMFKINKMKKEADVLKLSGDSKIHTCDNKAREDEQRFWMVVKLFILMGGTWLMEILSWAIGGSKWIWLIPDIINCSRGVIIFVLCVWNNKKVRASFLERVWSQFASIIESSEISRGTSELRDCSLTANNPTNQNILDNQDTPL